VAGGGCRHEAPLAAGKNSPVARFSGMACCFSLGGGTILGGDVGARSGGDGCCVA
jgi:hypothetical protein